MPVNFELKSATIKDVPWLLELRSQTMSGYLQESGLSISESSLKDRVLYRFDLTQIIHRATEHLGMLKIDRGPDFWTLIQIQIVPELQGEGIATRLIEQLLSAAHESSVSVRLSVLKTNPARSLYERLGFVVISEDEHSYEMQNKGELATSPQDLGDPEDYSQRSSREGPLHRSLLTLLHCA